MNKKFLIPSVIIVLLLIGGIAYLSMSLHKERQENKEMQELAEMDKKEMENEYQQFADQYSEMKSKITMILSWHSLRRSSSRPRNCSRS